MFPGANRNDALFTSLAKCFRTFLRPSVWLNVGVELRPMDFGACTFIIQVGEEAVGRASHCSGRYLLEMVSGKGSW